MASGDESDDEKPVLESCRVDGLGLRLVLEVVEQKAAVAQGK
jgi:hypothetical protein